MYHRDEDSASELDPHADKLRMFRRWDKALNNHWSQWRVETRLAYDMVAGEQWGDARSELEEQLIAPITFNRIAPMVDAVAGAEINNRHETKFYPREMGDIGVNELLTNAAKWVRDECDAEDEETDAFFDNVVCGMGWTETRMDYEENEQGDVVIDRVDPLEMAVDPAARKRNAADAKYLRRRRSYTKEEFKEEHPEWYALCSASEDGDEDGVSTSHGSSGDDYAEDDGNNETMDTERQYKVSEYQWFERETVFVVADPTTGQAVTMGPEKFGRIKEKFQEMGVELQHAERKARRYYRAFACGNRVLEVEPLDKEEFTYKCITGKRDRNRGTWYGIVKAMIDPQRWANKWMTQILHILNTNAKGGILAETDAFEDPSVAEEEYAMPNSITWMKSGAVAAGKVQNKPQPPYPQGLDRLMTMAVTSIRDVTGINQELLGMADKNQPGILEAQRKEAGYAILAMFFDSLRRYRKMHGRLLLKFIRMHISDGRLIRVIGDNGLNQYVPLVYQDDVAEYDVIVDEAPSGPNQKDKVWNMLVQMVPLLRTANLGPDVWAKLLEYSPLPTGLSQELGQAITKPPSPEQQEKQQMAEAMALEEKRADIRETLSKAMENESDAELNRVKAQQEALDTMIKQLIASNPGGYPLEGRVIS